MEMGIALIFSNSKYCLNFYFFNTFLTRIMPSFNYSIDVFTSNGAQKLITLLMIDTIWICGNSPSTTSGPPKNAIHFYLFFQLIIEL